MRRKKLIVGFRIALGVLAVLAIAFVAIWFAVLKPEVKRIQRQLTGFPCVQAFEDRNGDGQLDPGDQMLADLPGARVQVLDPNGPDGGRYSLKTCYITPTASRRTLTLIVTLPPDCVATTPLQFEVTALESAYFIDFPPRASFGVRESVGP